MTDHRSPARAAVLRGSDQPFAIEPVWLDAPRGDEVLVRLIATGVCHTDMVMRDQHLPTPQPVVLGHEGAGIVEKVGADVVHLAPGDHVVLTFNSCGTCPSCADDAPAYCHDFFPRNFMGTRPDGTTPICGSDGRIHGNIFGQSSFATHAIARGRNSVKVSKDAPLELLGPLGCGVMTGAGAVMNALDVQPAHAIAVFGTGAVGLSAIMAAKAVGAHPIIAVDINKARLQLALELGATFAFDATADDLADTILHATGGIGLDYALDTTARTPILQTAASLLAPRGTLGLVGASAPGEKITLETVSLMSGGRTVRGIVEGDADPHSFIPQLVSLYLDGRFPFDRLVEFFPFERINDAIAAGESGQVVKPILLI